VKLWKLRKAAETILRQTAGFGRFATFGSQITPPERSRWGAFLPHCGDSFTLRIAALAVKGYRVISGLSEEHDSFRRWHFPLL